jgi:hypothetical protein
MVTNPAPLLLQNGTALLYFRGTQWPVNGEERIGLATSSSWKGPFVRIQSDPLWNYSDSRMFVEDPFVWEDKRGFHMLTHGHWDENGYYACSVKAEGPWQFRLSPSYTNVLAMKDGTNVTLVQRERPQLFFDEKSGQPSLLFTGVAPPGASFYGYTYTHVQPINSKSTESTSRPTIRKPKLVESF